MLEPNLIEATSDREISRLIRYLDPDMRDVKHRTGHHPDFESVITLALLLGGVVVCFVVLFIHAAE